MPRFHDQSRRPPRTEGSEEASPKDRSSGSSWPSGPLWLTVTLFCSLVFVLVLLPCSSWAANRYDPHLRFRVIRTPHFSVLFHQGEDDLAARLAAVAEEVHVTLSRRLNVWPERHTRVILVDQNDVANGWATPLPFDTIEISAVAPAPSAPIGNTDDWLRLVFTHEYTHILHLDQSRGLFAGLRRVFGRAPLLFPNMFLPGWDTEGLATFYETADTGLGRLRSGEFRLIVDAAGRAQRVDPIDRATGALVDWPSGNGAYAYGARFHEYLAQRFGVDTFSRLAAATAGRVPYFPGGAYKKVFGARAKDLWRDFAAAVPAGSDGGLRRAIPTEGSDGGLRQPVPTDGSTIVRLTRQGFVAAGPRWLPDGSLIYSSRTPHEFPSINVIHPDGKVTRLTERYLGEQVSVWNGRAFFDQRELVRNVGLQSDLYVVSLTTGRVQRLTRGERAFDPDISPDGLRLVYTVQEPGRSVLMLRAVESIEGGVRLGAGKVLRDDGPETRYAAPRWSPGGQFVAAERRRLHERPCIVVIDVDRRSAARVSATEGRPGMPEWLDESRLILSWEKPDSPFDLYEVDLAARSARALVGLPNGARSAAVSPSGDRVAFVGYTVDGYDIFSTLRPAQPGHEVSGLKVESEEPTGPAVPSPQSRAPGVTSYSPIDTLLPRFWMPVVETDEDRVEVGAGTVGVDALGRHAFASTVRWADRARPDWDASYAYDRWRPTFVLAASDDLTVWQGSDYRETSVDAGALVPFNTVRRRQWVYGALHATREKDTSRTFDRRSLRLAYQFGTARRYGYSITQQDGIVAGLTSEITRAALGSDADATTVTADIRAYPRVGGRHRVLAVRGAFAASFGDRDGRRVLGAGGTSAPGTTITFGRDAIALARGFATDDIVGYRAAVLNMDYRFPLLNVQRGVGRLPVFIRQMHAAVFVDAAHAWRRSFHMADARTSAGFELSSDTVLGHYLPLTITGGIAFRRDPRGLQDGAAIFGRLGYAF